MDSIDFDINKFSDHLFWDVDKSAIDKDLHKKFIVKRVLEYGLLSDWIIISKYYKKENIAAIAVSIRQLDGRSLSFISAYTDIPKEKFRCYTTQRSTIKHWLY